ncbi:unnamed protein product, partial [Meganyctiphanes norvegica]
MPTPFPHGTGSLNSSWSSENSLSSYPIMSTGPHPPPQQQQQPPQPSFHGHRHPIQQNVAGQPIRRPTPRPPTLRHPAPHPAPHPPPTRHPAPMTLQGPRPPLGAQIPIQQNAQQQHVVAAANRSSSRKQSLPSDKVAIVAGGSRKQSLPVTDRRQAVYNIQNSLSSVPQQVPSPGSGTPSPIPGSTNIPAGTPAPTQLSSNGQTGAQSSQAAPNLAGVYEPIMDRAMGVRTSFKDNRRLERDPDGRVYEVVKTRIVESGPRNPNTKVKNGAPLQRSVSCAAGEAEAKRVRVQSLSPPRLKNDTKNARGRSTSARKSNAGLQHGSVQSLNSLQNEVPVKSGRPRPYGQRSNTEPLYSSIDAVNTNDRIVIDRIKRNVDRKEEFLNRPNQPIWLPSSKAQGVHRDYHVSPQKMPKPQWPPPPQTPPSPGAITKALNVVAAKGEHHQLRRTRSEIERTTRSNTRHGSSPNIQLVSQVQTIVPVSSFTTDDLPLQKPSQTTPPSSLVSNSVPKPYNGTSTPVTLTDPASAAAAAAAAAARYGKAFVTTLSRIQENIPAQEIGSQSSLASTTTQGTRMYDSATSSLMGTPFGSQNSLNSPSSRSIPLAWVGDNERIKQLQIVSKRAKQFENREEKENFAKSAFQRFELTRLSQRSKVPNVAKMKEELDKKEEDSSHKVAGFGYEFGLQFNTPRQRKSVELSHYRELSSPDYAPSPPKVLRSLSDGGNVFPVSRRLYCSPSEESPKPVHRDHQVVIMGGVGNRAIPIGGGRIHCEPPGGYNIRPYSDPDVLERERSNSLESGVSMWSVMSADELQTKQKTSNGKNSSYRMSTAISTGSDGEVGKGHGERKRCPPTTGGTQPSPQPSPTMTSSLTSDHHVPRPKRPNFLPLKNHAMPALSASEASPSANSRGEGSSDGRLERLHESLPFFPSTKQNAPSSSACSSLSNSMLQIPTVATPTPATPEDGGDVTPVVTPGGTPTTPTPTTATPSATATTTSNTHLAPDHHQVHRRAKHIYDDEGERLVRRVSYLKATSGDRMYSDSDLDSDSEESRNVFSSLCRLRVDGAVVAAAGVLSAATPLGPLCVMDLPSPASLQSAVVRQANIHVKLTMVDGKKAGDRSWKTVWAVVQGRALIFYKDKQHATQVS